MTSLINNINFIILWNTLSNFVTKMCKYRDESHGHAHMSNVALRSLNILKSESKTFEFNNNDIDLILKYTMIVAWLHDVADHKYDEDGSLAEFVNEFVLELCNSDKESCELITKMIGYVSYSKENNAILKGTPIDFIRELGILGAFVRDIVSDADKLEALGKNGVQRCFEYNRHLYCKKYKVDGVANSIIKEFVIQHANDKLLRLKDEFIRTETGKILAISLHEEFKCALDQIN